MRALHHHHLSAVRWWHGAGPAASQWPGPALPWGEALVGLLWLSMGAAGVRPAAPPCRGPRLPQACRAAGPGPRARGCRVWWGCAGRHTEAAAAAAPAAEPQPPCGGPAVWVCQQYEREQAATNGPAAVPAAAMPAPAVHAVQVAGAWVGPGRLPCPRGPGAQTGSCTCGRHTAQWATSHSGQPR